MAKTLVIVESPVKCKTISKILGNKYIVQASVGHVVDLTSTGKNNMGVNINNGFEPKYDIIPDKRDKLKAIIKYASQSDNILLATDPDREGEAIAWHLAQLLNKTGKPIKRVEFPEITKECILRNIKLPRELNNNLFQAQQARRVLDRIVGYSVSPFLIDKFGTKLSAGRVQSVSVKIVVDREREIDAFEPDEYWNITSTLSKNDEAFVAKYANKVSNGDVAQQIKLDLNTDNYIVETVKETEQKKKPNAPFITSSLQSAAAGKYRFTTSRTMKAAQALYESGAITYIRTDSTRLASNAIDFCRQWLSENGYDLPEAGTSYGSKKSAQDGHEAIRPTNVNVTPKNVYLTDDQQKVYTLIWERFVASQMKPALYDSVNVIVKTSSNHKLRASGRTLKYKGWLEIAGDLNKRDDKNILLPILTANDELDLVPPNVTAEQKFTKPPARFTEKSLVDELVKKGIGRPSTYAAIMSKITGRSYVIRKSNVFVATDKGKQVVDELTKFFAFMDYNYTANMEKRLDEIAAGKLEYVDMMNEFYDPFKDQLKQAYMSSNEDYGFRCIKCKKNTPMFLHHGKFGYYLACVNYPKTCKYTMSCQMVDNKPVIKSTRGEINDKVRCPNCQSGMVKLDGQFGPYYGCSEYPYCRGKRKAPYGKKCPECKNDLYATLYNNEGVLFCMGYHTVNCRYSEPLPKGELIDPKSVTSKKIPKKISKLIK